MHASSRRICHLTKERGGGCLPKPVTGSHAKLRAAASPLPNVKHHLVQTLLVCGLANYRLHEKLTQRHYSQPNFLQPKINLVGFFQHVDC